MKWVFAFTALASLLVALPVWADTGPVNNVNWPKDLLIKPGEQFSFDLSERYGLKGSYTLLRGVDYVSLSPSGVLTGLAKKEDLKQMFPNTPDGFWPDLIQVSIVEENAKDQNHSNDRPESGYGVGWQISHDHQSCRDLPEPE